MIIIIFRKYNLSTKLILWIFWAKTFQRIFYLNNKNNKKIVNLLLITEEKKELLIQHFTTTFSFSQYWLKYYFPGCISWSIMTCGTNKWLSSTPIIILNNALILCPDNFWAFIRAIRIMVYRNFSVAKYDLICSMFKYYCRDYWIDPRRLLVIAPTSIIVRFWDNIFRCLRKPNGNI